MRSVLLQNIKKIFLDKRNSIFGKNWSST